MRSANIYAKKFTITLAMQLVQRIDELAKRNYTSRTEIIRVALIEYLQMPGNMGAPARPVSDDSELDEVMRQFHESELRNH